MSISQGPPGAHQGSQRPSPLAAEVYDKLLESLGVAIVISDGDGFVVRANAAARSLLGGRGAPLEGRAVVELVGADEQDDALRAHLRIAAEGGTHRLTWRSLGLDEETYVVRDAQGAAYRVSRFSPAVSHDDLSDETLRRMKEELREKLELVDRQGGTIRLLSRVLNSAPIVLLGVDGEGAITLADGKGIEALSPDPNDLLGEALLERLPDPALATALDRVFKGEDARTAFEGAPGRYFDGWLSPLRKQRTGEVGGALLFAIDASERVSSEAELREQLVLIERQAATIRSLATPIIKVAAGVLCLPVIGVVDSSRAAQIMELLLDAVTRERASYAILDLTGVELIDTSSADHLLQIVRAASVLGVESILSGLRPAVAQTVVALGVDLTQVRTMRSLEAALRYCQRKLESSARENRGRNAAPR